MASQADLAIAQANALYIKFTYLPWLTSKTGGAGSASFDEREEKFATANAMMVKLVDGAYGDDAIKQVIAQNGLFEALLTQERNGLVIVPRWTTITDYALDIDPSEDIQPMRQLLLGSMLRAGTGWWLGKPDARGVVPWINSVSASARAMAQTVAYDPLPVVLMTAIKILESVNIPPAWVAPQANPVFGAQPTQSELVSAVTELRGKLAAMTICPSDSTRKQGDKVAGNCVEMPAAIRGAMSGVLDRTIGRFQQLQGQASVDATIAPGAIFAVTGDGTQVALPPAPQKPWYRDGRKISGGLLGLLAGALVAARAKSR